MCKLMEDFGEEMREEGEKRRAISSALVMLSKKRFSYEEISEITGLTISEIKELDKKCSA